MPKLKKSREQEAASIFRALYEKNKRLQGVANNEEIADRIGVSRTTFSTYLSEPHKMRGQHLNRLFATLKYSDEDKLEILKSLYRINYIAA